MTTEMLRRAHRADPFRPFSLRLADGRAIPVARPESLAYNPGGRAAAVIDESDGIEMVDLEQVVSIDFEGEPAAAK